MQYDKIQEFKRKTEELKADMITNDFARVRNYTNWDNIDGCRNLLLINFEYNSVTNTYSLALLPEVLVERPSFGGTLIKNIFTFWLPNIRNYEKKIRYIYPSADSVVFMPNKGQFNIKQVDLIPLTDAEIHPDFVGSGDELTILKIRMQFQNKQISSRELQQTERKINQEVQSHYNRRDRLLTETGKRQKEEDLEYKQKEEEKEKLGVKNEL